MRILNGFVRVTIFIAAHAFIFAAAAAADAASAHKSSRTASTHTASNSPPIIKPGDGHHHRHGHRFVFVGRFNDYRLFANRCMVRRIGPDGFPVWVIVRSVPPCRVAAPVNIIGY